MRRLSTLALSLLLTIPLFASEDVIRKGFNVSEGGTLRLDASIGSIKIVSGGSGVAVEITRKARGRAGEERMREHKISVSQQGNDVVIDSANDDHDWGFFDWGGDYEVQWNVRVPSRYNVNVRTSGGSIDLADIGGTVDARTSGGSIKTGKLAGDAQLKTSGGSIRVAGASSELEAHTSGGSIEIGDAIGRVEAKTSGGSITLARVGGNVFARTSGGGIRIEDAGGTVDASTSGGSITASLSRPLSNDSKLSTSGGGITVALAENMKLELDARASGGGVTSDVPITVRGKQDDDSLQGQINGGGPKLTLRTSGGGIRVKSL
ncbi:MAG TPA: DUF4097 family beta strand repeat-containing protein [Thermoanaerobaculia bacterium]|nr:DUF4097 family beta strand repeat-containing protein [Thermoanaerobaculia bacterium]